MVRKKPSVENSENSRQQLHKGYALISNDMLKYEIEPQSRTNKKSGKKMQPFNIKKKKESLEEWNQT